MPDHVLIVRGFFDRAVCRLCHVTRHFGSITLCGDDFAMMPWFPRDTTNFDCFIAEHAHGDAAASRLSITSSIRFRRAEK